MNAAPSERPARDIIEYHAFAAARSAEIRIPDGDAIGTVLIVSGQAMFGLDFEQPGARRLIDFGAELADGLVDHGFAVVQPDAIDATRSIDACVEAVSSLLEATRAHHDLGTFAVVGLSVAAPLLAVATSDPVADAFILVSPPILETYGNRPDRVDLPLAQELGISPELAASLGGLAPMHAGASLSSRAMVLHGAADTVAPPSDAIGWRASLAANGVDAARVEIGFGGHDLDPCRDSAIRAILEYLDGLDG